MYQEQAERLINFLAGRIGRDAAREVSQEVWLEFFTWWRQQPNEAAPTGMLYRIARCRAVDRIRQAGRTAPVEGRDLEDLSGRLCRVDGCLEKTALRLDLKQALGELTERERQAVHLHHIDGLSVADTAAVMCLRIDNTKRILKKARQTLRRSPGMGGYEEPDQ
ncbi:RNA polymerase sigma factor [Streptomyces collinus]|uniref:RNA polymerase sigma factor n=1 Tax=Streptomyces collinus TaxID=42684 RepID=UPI0036A2CF8C